MPSGRDQVNARESESKRASERTSHKRELRREGNKIKSAPTQRAVSAISWRPVSLFPPSLARVAPRSRGQDSILLALWVRQRPPFANSSYPAETPPKPKPVFFNLLFAFAGPAIVVISSVAWCPCAASPLSWDIALGTAIFVFCWATGLLLQISPPAEPSARH